MPTASSSTGTSGGAYAAELALALKLADVADAVTFPRFQASDLSVDTKPDMTPVSDADLACERALRTELQRLCPDDEVLGEEFGGTASFSGRQWVIDPIDATKNYVRGVPVWATLIALLVDGKPVVGVVSAPALGRRWWASAGDGAFRQALGKPAEKISVSKVARIEDASVSFSSCSSATSPGVCAVLVTFILTAWWLRAPLMWGWSRRCPCGISLP